MNSKILKQISRATGKAIHDYKMISHKERILVGLSGGKDSLTLLKILIELKKRAPVDFDILPLYVDPGFKNGFALELQDYVKNMYGELRVEFTNHGVYAHSPENRENPCFLCSRLRRKSFFDIAKEEGCNKIALGHNKDDIIETLFMNMFYSGRISTMRPNQPFFKGDISIIRPLSYVEKDNIIKFGKTFNLPNFENPCPSDGITKRSAIRGFLQEIYKEGKHIKGNIFRAMGNVETNYLLK